MEPVSRLTYLSSSIDLGLVHQVPPSEQRLWAGKEKKRASSATNGPEAIQSQVQQPQTHVSQRSEDQEEEEDINEVPGKKIKGCVILFRCK
jgi:hypothetical protein